jgi:MFS family permease
MGLAELGFATVIPLLPLYLKVRLGASTTLVGVVLATFAAVETVLKTTWGSLADRIGKRPVVVCGLLLGSVAPAVMTLLRAPVLFVPLRFVDGSGSAAVWPAVAAAVADRTDPDRRAAGMGVLNSFFLSGLALGPSLGLFVSGVFGSYHAGFYLASGLLLSAAAVASFTLRDGSTSAHAAPSPRAGEEAGWIFPRLRRSPRLAAMLAVGFVQMFGAGLLAPILVIYAHEIMRLSDQAIGALFLVVVLAVAGASVPGGRLADRIGRPRTVTAGMSMASIGMWILPLAGTGSLPILVIAGSLLGGSYALSSPAWLALMAEAAPAGGTGMAMGASETAQGAGLILGPLLGGFLYDQIGPQAPFLGSALLLTAGTVLAIRAVSQWDPQKATGGSRG